MKRYIKVTVLVALALGALALAGCSAQGESKDKDAGMELPKVWGYVTGEEFGQLEVADQLGTETLVVDRVLAPSDAWIVVHLDDNGMPGERVGLKRVSKGESLDVGVPLEGVTTEKVIVAVHADKGTADKFEFDMDKKLESPDRPFFVNDKELAKAVAVRTFGVKAEKGQASVQVSDQPGATDTLTVDNAVSPGPAFLVVHLDDDGMPGERVGYAAITAGDSRSVVVKLTPGIKLTDALLVAVHADRGVIGTLEFDMEDKVGSPDQPFFVDGDEVATKVSVK